MVLKKKDGTLTAFRATGERMDVDLYTVDNLTIGKFIKEKPIVTIIDADLPNCDGIISLNPFEKQPFPIDLQRKLFILETHQSLLKRKSNGTRISLYPDQDRGLSLDVFSNFVLNNEDTLQFLLDSGAGQNSFWINSRYLPTCGIDTTDTAQVTRIERKSEFNKAVETVFYKAKVPNLSLQGSPGINVKNFYATFSSSLIYDGKVTINWFGKQISFDFAGKEMIVKK